ncbi:MAG: hypothetical protein RL088_4122 [Verrucomicrobiota bacterium]|jgi:hypothetical protein
MKTQSGRFSFARITVIVVAVIAFCVWEMWRAAEPTVSRVAFRSRHFDSPFIIFINGEPIGRMSVGDVFGVDGYPLRRENEAVLTFANSENSPKWEKTVTFVDPSAGGNSLLAAKLVSQDVAGKVAKWGFELPLGNDVEQGEEFDPLPPDGGVFTVQCLEWLGAMRDAVLASNRERAANLLGYKEARTALPAIANGAALVHENAKEPTVIRGKKFALICSADGAPLINAHDKADGFSFEIPHLLVARKRGEWHLCDAFGKWRKIESFGKISS